MQVNADFSERVVIDTTSTPWAPSPEPGVDRKLLDRIGGEVARATSIVRYAPGSKFHAHTHGLGEEFLVLTGTFSDEHGDYPPGSYVRNPPGSRHAPRSDAGCEIFVKLRQFDPADTARIVIRTRETHWLPGLVRGLSVMPLHEFGTEHVALVRWQPGTRFSTHTHAGGEEILVLEGVFCDERGEYPAGTWLRSPHMSRHTPYSDAGCLIWVKTGHLPPAVDGPGRIAGIAASA
jgi:anti-sigma factor ChrR (cupin superfamily)